MLASLHVLPAVAEAVSILLFLNIDYTMKSLVKLLGVMRVLLV